MKHWSINNLPKNKGSNEWGFSFLATSKFNRLFQWYESLTEDCISVKTEDCFEWAKKENQKHFSRHLRANSYSSPLICRTFFISLSKKPKTKEFFFRFFYCLFCRLFWNSCMQHTYYTYASQLLDCRSCDCIAFALVIFSH